MLNLVTINIGIREWIEYMRTIFIYLFGQIIQYIEIHLLTSIPIYIIQYAYQLK
jgi:hypothetical protein